MISENYIESKNGHPFQKDDFKTISDFVNKYDQLYAELKKLEDHVQKVVALQGDLVKELEGTRNAELQWFVNLSEKSGVEISELKKLAAAWASDNRSETFYP
jgi:t-SNARE complex subunit (syntaxin)